MNEKFPPNNELLASRNDRSEYSNILNELAKIRQDIERDSMSAPLYHSGNVDSESFSRTPDSSRLFYRFDHDHSEREGHGSLNTDSQTTFYHQWQPFPTIPGKTVRDDDFDMHDVDLTEPSITQKDNDFPFRQKREHTDQYPKQNYRHEKYNNSEIKKNYRHDDDSPVVIPIRQAEIQTIAQNSNFVTHKPRSDYREDRHDKYHKRHVVDLSALPWGMFSQYENETFLKLSRNASNLSLLIGWVAIACGVVIFVRSFFVSSMIWLNFGLPVLSLGAACLFLGIILSILSEKMQHINDLKQSLTTHRILTPAKRKSEDQAHQHETDESEDMYDRLMKLRSEINELIEECENP